MEHDHAKQLGEERISRLLLKFSGPAIVGMLVNALYNIVDRFFVGNFVGPLAISAATVAFPIMIILMAFGMLIAIGATAQISIRLGQNKRDEAEKILGNAFVLLIITGIILMVAGFAFLSKLLVFLGASPEVFPYAYQYTSIILVGTVFQMLSFGLNSLIRGDANPMMAMATMVIAAVLNAILNPICIIGFHMGIRGSALATIISQLVGTIMMLYYFFSGKSMLKILWRNMRLSLKIIIGIFSIGMSPFFMQVAASVVTTLFNTSLERYGGDIAVAAMGTINSIAMLILMPIFGINQGVQPIIGYNYGAKKYDRVKKALKLAIIAATTIATTGFLIVEILPSQIISIFNSADRQFVNTGAHGIRIFLMMLPIIGFQIVSSNYFQAVGKPAYAMLLSLARQVFALIPLILILPGIFGLQGIWSAGPSSDFIASLVTAVFLIREIKHLDDKHEENIQLILNNE